MADQQGINALGTLIGLGYGMYKQSEKKAALDAALKGKDPVQALQAYGELNPSAWLDPKFQKMHYDAATLQMAQAEAKAKADQAAKLQADEAAGQQYMQAAGQYSPATIVDGKPIGPEGYAAIAPAISMNAPDAKTATLLSNLNQNAEKYGQKLGEMQQADQYTQGQDVLKSALRQGEQAQQQQFEVSNIGLRHKNDLAKEDYQAKLQRETAAIERMAPKPLSEGSRIQVAQNVDLANQINEFGKRAKELNYAYTGTQGDELSARRSALKTTIMYGLFGGTSTKEQEDMVDRMLPDPQLLFKTNRGKLTFHQNLNLLENQWRQKAQSIAAQGGSAPPPPPGFR